MGQFKSSLFDYLYAVSDVPYNPNKPDDAPIEGTPFLNIDARRMDRMKTTIMQIILRRARNFMKNTSQDEKESEWSRFAVADFVIVFTTSNIYHSDQAGPTKQSAKKDEDGKAPASGDEPLSFSPSLAGVILGTNGRPLASTANFIMGGTYSAASGSVCDNINGVADAELMNWIDLFRQDQHIKGCSYEKLSLSCVPRTGG